MSDDDDATVIIQGKLKRALNYYVTDVKLWYLLAGAVAAFLLGVWAG